MNKSAADGPFLLLDEPCLPCDPKNTFFPLKILSELRFSFIFKNTFAPSPPSPPFGPPRGIYF